MKTQLNPWFVVPYAVLLAAAGSLFFFIERGEVVLFVNSFHSPFFDALFAYGTTLGHGLLYFLVALGLAWKNQRNGLIALICLAVSGLLVQLLKETVFDEVMRPSVALAGEPLHFVEGVKLLKRHSFPSGHTATAFSLFCLLSFIVKEKKWGLAFLSMALIGGISRIYLVQHFFVDVYFGSIIGVVVTSLIWFWFEKTQKLQHWNNVGLKSKI